MVITLSGGSALFVLLWFLVLAAVGCTARTAGGPPRVPVSVARVEVRAVPYEIAATGAVEPIRSVNVTSQVSGMLRRVRFAEGDEVKQGQVLLEIDRRPYLAALQQAEANLSRDLAQAENAARDAERYRVLAQDRSVTEEDYQQKQATADALRATVRADSGALTVARLNLEYATIRAPIAGRTGSLLVREGNLVRANESAILVTINQLRPIVVRFAVRALPANHDDDDGGADGDAADRDWMGRGGGVAPPLGPRRRRGAGLFAADHAVRDASVLYLPRRAATPSRSYSPAGDGDRHPGGTSARRLT
jgi:multidrug efflux pump subunit AcrA (membrane-fusion protein)